MYLSGSLRYVSNYSLEQLLNYGHVILPDGPTKTYKFMKRCGEGDKYQITKSVRVHSRFDVHFIWFQFLICNI